MLHINNVEQKTKTSCCVTWSSNLFCQTTQRLSPGMVLTSRQRQRLDKKVPIQSFSQKDHSDKPRHVKVAPVNLRNPSVQNGPLCFFWNRLPIWFDEQALKKVTSCTFRSVHRLWRTKTAQKEFYRTTARLSHLEESCFYCCSFCERSHGKHRVHPKHFTGHFGADSHRPPAGMMSFGLT